MEAELRDKLTNIKTLILPFDGILTDGYVYLNAHEEEIIRYSQRDLEGIQLLLGMGIRTIIFTINKSQMIHHICQKVKVTCWHIHEKTGSCRKAILELLADKSNAQSEVAYIGSKLNDLEAMKLVGAKISVEDSHPKIHSLSDYITKKPGGCHAVREVCDLILEAKKVYEE